MFLALQLGMTLAKAKRAITMRELVEWQAYYAIEPFGAQRDDLRMALQTAAILNPFRSKGTPAINPIDLMPFLDAEKPKAQSTESMAASFAMFAQGHNQVTTTK